MGVREQLLDRIETRDVEGYCSTQVLGEVIHRLMTVEASSRFGWPVKGIAQRLRKNSAEVRSLIRHRQALDEIALVGLQILPVPAQLVSPTVDVSQLTGLLYNDSNVVAVMRDRALTHLASQDADFDRIPGITRYAAV
jgi:predicted nucleic acid-binding protein